MTQPRSRQLRLHPFLRLLATWVLLLAGASATVLAARPAAQEDGTTAAPLQLVVVTISDWDATTGTLRYYGRATPDAPWREAGRFAVSIGRSGAAWGEGLHPAADQGEGPAKREGDGRSPAGVFALGPAFGYPPADEVDTALPYRRMDASHWCMDVPGSPHYNRIVDAREVGQAAVAGSSEPMRLDLHHDGDPRYRLGLVIAHNPGNTPGHGSCIFAHLWRQPGEPTAGCTAMAEEDMRRLLAWLDPAAQPRFVLLPRTEYARLAPRWDLPAAGSAR
ncbi:L,D-transpeptidase family protein [Pseudoxanthomonas suwonensis]